MTQTELDALLAAAIDRARAVGIPVSRRICPQVRLNRRARTRFGCCVRRDGEYTIELSALLARELEGQGVRPGPVLAIPHGHPPAPAGKQPGRGGSDPSGTAGDQRVFHRFPPLSVNFPQLRLIVIRRPYYTFSPPSLQGETRLIKTGPSDAKRSCYHGACCVIISPLH